MHIFGEWRQAGMIGGDKTTGMEKDCVLKI